MRGKLSAVVIAYNRAALIGTCLRGLGFADEVIVVDKSSTDGTAAIAARHADRVITVPWSPTVEETRAFAMAQCTHDWIIFLDDDECLSVEAIRFIQEELRAPRADVYGLLQRHYILGTHDEAAYYWPEHQIRMFRRGTVTFGPTVHGGTEVHSDSVLRVAPDTGVAIHNLSHEDVAQWIEKTNRYTSRRDRDRVADHGRSLRRFAHDSIDHWLMLTHDAAPGGYPEAVAVLRATYDLIDRLKTWEEERGVDGAVEFQRLCAHLDAQYASLGFVRDRAGHSVTAAPYSPKEVDEHEVLRRRLSHLRARHDAVTAERDAHAAEAARLAGDLASLGRLRDETQHALEGERTRAEQAEAECTRTQAEAIAQRQRAEQAEIRLNTLEGEHSALRGEHDRLRGEHEVLGGEHDVLRGAHDRLRGEHDVLGGEHDRLRGERDRLHGEHDRLRGEYDRLCGEHDRLRSEHDMLGGEHDRLRSEHAGLERQHELLKGSLHTFLRFYLPRLRRHLIGQRP